MILNLRNDPHGHLLIQVVIRTILNQSRVCRTKLFLDQKNCFEGKGAEYCQQFNSSVRHNGACIPPLTSDFELVEVLQISLVFQQAQHKM